MSKFKIDLSKKEFKVVMGKNITIPEQIFLCFDNRNIFKNKGKQNVLKFKYPFSEYFQLYLIRENGLGLSLYVDTPNKSFKAWNCFEGSRLNIYITEALTDTIIQFQGDGMKKTFSVDFKFKKKLTIVSGFKLSE